MSKLLKHFEQPEHVGLFLFSVQARVCYIGQEPAAENKYRWYIDERNLCACTEFRLGGLNNKPKPRPSGVGDVYYIPFTTNKEKISEVIGCNNGMFHSCEYL